MANGDHDFVAGEILTAANVDDYLMLQSVQKFATAAARDAALTTRKREGSVSIQDDLNTITVYSGAAWSSIGPVHGALATWTPTITQSVGVALTVTYARYMRIGRMIQCWYLLTVTGSGTAANAVVIGGLPFTAATSGLIVGSGNLRDNSGAPATANYSHFINLVSTTTLDLRYPGTSADDNRIGVVGFTAGLAVSDTVHGFFQYEAAADA